jgi:hypothetical protein
MNTMILAATFSLRPDEERTGPGRCDARQQQRSQRSRGRSCESRRGGRSRLVTG